MHGATPQLFPQSAHKDVYSNEDAEINDDIYGKLNHLVHPHDEDFTQCYSGLLQDEESYRFLHTKVSKCPKCDAVFNNVDNLTVSLHLFRHYAGQLINMVKFGEDNFCEECGMTMASRQSFFLHSAIAHNQVQISRLWMSFKKIIGGGRKVLFCDKNLCLVHEIFEISSGCLTKSGGGQQYRLKPPYDMYKSSLKLIRYSKCFPRY